MKKNFTILILFSIAIFHLFDKIECENNPGRQFKCWPNKLWPQNFPVEFYFSSRAQKHQLLRPTSIIGTNGIDFDPSRRTTVIIHGFLSNGKNDNFNILTEELIKLENMNVISVNWEAGCNNAMMYHQASANTEFVALKLRNVIVELMKLFRDEADFPLQNWGAIHFVGFSLGAHVAGHAADLLRRKDNIAIHRVTGLDPAEPCFEDADNPLRLSRDNAAFVDVVHTDIAKIRNGAFGIPEPMGHADFYVNGGTNQPGCINRVQRSNYLNYYELIMHLVNNRVCNHIRALLLFILSTKQAYSDECKFWAYPWRLNSSPTETQSILRQRCDFNTCTEMGIKAEFYKYNINQNVYYVPTTDRLPYCDVP